MSGRVIRLYGIPLSHPVLAIREMVVFKRLVYRYVELFAGAHPAMLWALGFRGATVPAMKLPDGRRIQGSLAIAQALEQFAPAPSRYPAQPAAHAAVADAERCRDVDRLPGLVADRPAATLARRIVADYPVIAAALPEWLLRGGVVEQL